MFFHGVWPRGHFGLCFFMVFGGLVQIQWKNKAQNGQAAKYHGKTKPKLENGGLGFVSRGGNSRQTIKTIKIYWFFNVKIYWFFNGFWFFLWAFCNKKMKKKKTLKTAHEKPRKTNGFQWFLGVGVWLLAPAMKAKNK